MKNADHMNQITVEVVYAFPQRHTWLTVQVEAPQSVQEVITQSGILTYYPEIDLTRQKVGIFGKIVSLETPVKQGDRIEIYRELIADPKASRRQRAAGQGAKMPKT